MTNKITPDRVINPVTVLAWDGESFYALKCNEEGILEIDAVVVEMPEGLATEATLLNRASEAKLELVRLLLVSLAAEDFATQTTLAALAGEDFATQVTLAALLTELALKADFDETQPVSVASLPLPTNAATDASVLALLESVWDGSAWKKRIGTASGDASVAGYCRDTSNWRALRVNDNGELEVEVVSSGLPAGAAEQTTLALLATETTLGNLYLKNNAILVELKLKADKTETQPVSAASLPLPSGAATSAKQLAANHQVQVSNMISGFATSAKQDAALSELQEKHIGKPIAADGICYSNMMGSTNALHTAWTVPGGQYWVLTSMSAKCSSGALSELTLIVYDGAHNAVIAGRGATPQYDRATFNGAIYLLPNWQLNTWFRGGNAGWGIEIAATVHRIG